jgi:tetratricopeptide (TPR) repeat protein
MGLSATASGDLDEAGRRFRYATGAFRSLAAADSHNVQAWHSLAISLLQEGNLAVFASEADERNDRSAAPYYQEALRILQDLQENDPNNSRTTDLIEEVQSRMTR